MTRLRMDVQVAAPAARLIALTNALVLVPGTVPVEAVKTLHGLSRAVRSTLEAREPDVALTLLESMGALLTGVEGAHTEAVVRKIADLRAAITWKPRSEA